MEIKEIEIGFFWVSLLLSVIMFMVSLLILVQQRQVARIGKIVIGLILFSMVIANIAFGLNYYADVRNYPLDEMENQDYISSDYFRGISLDELQKDINSDNELLIYIGREDCKECKVFESKFEDILEQFYTEIPAYYTSKDREGDRREEMYELLENYDIDNVPCVIFVKQSQILKIWKNPENELEEIRKYL
ncbi:MAG: thioredoxin family protein [Clostridiaceae bacterium]|nr:thioredoxin family protein [Clostridiaceae bacterium]